LDAKVQELTLLTTLACLCLELKREAEEDWVKGFKGEETHVLSFINLKGGVGKTSGPLSGG
jgi:hypothetical protein